MKNQVLLLALLMASFSSLTAQLNFKPGDIEFAAGVGVLPIYAKDGATSEILPLNARVQLRLSSHFSLGAYASYASYQTNDRLLPDGTRQNLSNETLALGLRGTVHRPIAEKWDLYGGILLGYEMPDVQETIDGLPKSVSSEGKPSFTRPATNQLVYGAFMGASYYPRKHFGVFGELGSGISIVNVGLSMRL